MSHTVLVVAPDSPTRQRVIRIFRDHGFAVRTAEPARPLATLVLEAPDLVVVDMCGSLIHGIGECRQLVLTLGVPVMAVLGVVTEKTELLCFDAGAQDVVSHATSPAVLIARARKLLPLRPGTAARALLRVGPLALDRDARRLTCSEGPLHLGRIELSLLETLMVRPHHVVERAALKRVAWEDGASDRALESALSRTRRAVLDAGGPRIIVPMRGIGYRLGLD